MLLRPIRPADNPRIGTLIQQVLEEFNANKPGTAYFDKALFELYDSFQQPGACYWVLETGGRIMGGGGIYPTGGLPAGCCELVKLYLLPEARGKGWGRTLLAQCIRAAGEMGFTQIYLETLPELTTAIPLYQKAGFRCLSAPLGESGHFGCSVWMIRDL